jgi:hypothetical protein
VCDRRDRCEYPLNRSDVRWLEETFPRCEVHPINFLAFPAGVLSSYLFRSLDQSLTRATARDRPAARATRIDPRLRPPGIILIDKPSSGERSAAS